MTIAAGSRAWRWRVAALRCARGCARRLRDDPRRRAAARASASIPWENWNRKVFAFNEDARQRRC